MGSVVWLGQCLAPPSNPFLWTGTVGNVSRNHFGLLPTGPSRVTGEIALGYIGGQVSTARGLAEVGCPHGHQSHGSDHEVEGQCHVVTPLPCVEHPG